MEDHIDIEDTRRDNGFSLVELLIVIVILGILATVTVFAVTGITNKGKTSACQADVKTIQTAEEAYNATNADAGVYVDQPALKAAGLIHDVAPNFTVAVGPGTGTSASYTITGNAGDCFGING
jgi:prepilin-type N-terminal cleavage/methylation domain-containing protein